MVCTMKNIKDYIVVLKNIVPDELCDAILAEYSNSDEWQETAVGKGETNKKIRNCNKFSSIIFHFFEYII